MGIVHGVVYSLQGYSLKLLLHSIVILNSYFPDIAFLDCAIILTQDKSQDHKSVITAY